MKREKPITLATLTKSNVWDFDEQQIFALWDDVYDDEVEDCGQRYMTVIRSAFDTERIPQKFIPDDAEDVERESIEADNAAVRQQYIDQGMTVGLLPLSKNKQYWALRKHPIRRVTDLSYENIHHVTAEKLLDILRGNFGGGWDSLPQSVKDVITDGFDVATTTVPVSRLHRPGGLCEVKLADGYQLLEVEKGSWVEAIFVKAKPKAIKRHLETEPAADATGDSDIADDDDNETIGSTDNNDYDDEDDDDTNIDPSLLADGYRTTIDDDPAALSLDVADDEAADEY